MIRIQGTHIRASDHRVSSEKRSTSGPQVSCRIRKPLFFCRFPTMGASPSSTSTPFFSEKQALTNTPQNGVENGLFSLAKTHLRNVPKRAGSRPFVSKRRLEKWSTSGPQSYTSLLRLFLRQSQPRSNDLQLSQTSSRSPRVGGRVSSWQESTLKNAFLGTKGSKI